MSEAIRTEAADMPRVTATLWPEQMEWLEKRRLAIPSRPRKMTDVLREIIDQAMHADDERMAGAN